MENPPFEDVFPIQDGDFPLLCLFVYRRVQGFANLYQHPFGFSWNFIENSADFDSTLRFFFGKWPLLLQSRGDLRGSGHCNFGWWPWAYFLPKRHPLLIAVDICNDLSIYLHFADVVFWWGGGGGAFGWMQPHLKGHLGAGVGPFFFLIWCKMIAIFPWKSLIIIERFQNQQAGGVLGNILQVPPDEIGCNFSSSVPLDWQVPVQWSASKWKSQCEHSSTLKTDSLTKIDKIADLEIKNEWTHHGRWSGTV